MHFYFCFITNKIHFYILGVFFNKTVIRLALVDYLLSHIKQALEPRGIIVKHNVYHDG